MFFFSFNHLPHLCYCALLYFMSHIFVHAIQQLLRLLVELEPLKFYYIIAYSLYERIRVDSLDLTLMTCTNLKSIIIQVWSALLVFFFFSFWGVLFPKIMTSFKIFPYHSHQQMPLVPVILTLDKVLFCQQNLT